MDVTSQIGMGQEWQVVKRPEMAYNIVSSNSNLSVFCCFICTLIILFKVFSKTRRRRRRNIYNLPPSPPKFPIIGNLHQLATLPHRSLQALSHKYGPLMFVQLGQNPTLVVSSADIASEIFKSHDVSFSDRPESTAPKILLYGCKDVAFLPHGEEWRQKKKISVHELLSHKRVRSYRFIREDEVSCLINKIHEACERGCSVNLTHMLILVSSNFVSRCALGQNCETLKGKISYDEIVRRVTKQLQEFSFGNFLPSLGWLDYVTGLIPRLNKTFRELDAFFDCVIEQHKTKLRSRENNDVKNFLDILLQVQQDDMLGFELTQDSIKAMLVDMIVGGSDPTATTLEWGISELMRHPEKMKKVQEEVRGIVGCKSRIDEEDLNEMKYLKCVIKETLRLHPFLALVPRETSCSVKLRGYDIPKKTTVFVNVWAIHRDPEIWERAEEFIPERFENMRENEYKSQDFDLIPFGIGRRGCPGASFGIAFVEYVLANLLCWFDWKLPDEITTPTDLDMSEAQGITISKKVQLHLQPSLHSFA